MLGNVNEESRRCFIMLLYLTTAKINRILHCNWLPERRSKMAPFILLAWDSPRCVPEENCVQSFCMQ